MDFMKAAKEAQAKEMEANKKVAEVKIKLCERISDRLDVIDALSVDEIREMTNLLKELS